MFALHSMALLTEVCIEPTLTQILLRVILKSGIVALEKLEDLARSAGGRMPIPESGLNSEDPRKTLNRPHSGRLYLFGGIPVVDDVDWLDTRQLGFPEFERGNHTLDGKQVGFNI